MAHFSSITTSPSASGVFFDYGFSIVKSELIICNTKLGTGKVVNAQTRNMNTAAPTTTPSAIRARKRHI
jgi:hypothetical protein